MWHGYDGAAWLIVVDGLLWILVAGAAFFVVVRALERARWRNLEEPRDALEIAGRRYAQGEIDAGELAEIRRNLRPSRRRVAA